MTTCTECEAPARGDVPDLDGVPAHHCRQCADHCLMRAYLEDAGRAARRW